MRLLLVLCTLAAFGTVTRCLPATASPNRKHNAQSQESDCDSSEEESDEEALKRHEIVKAQARAAAHARMVALGMFPVTGKVSQAKLICKIYLKSTTVG